MVRLHGSAGTVVRGVCGDEKDIEGADLGNICTCWSLLGRTALKGMSPLSVDDVFERGISAR